MNFVNQQMKNFYKAVNILQFCLQITIIGLTLQHFFLYEGTHN
jgi:hypothetical protein